MIGLLGFLAELVQGLRDVPGLLRRISVLEREVEVLRALNEELYIGPVSDRPRTKS